MTDPLFKLIDSEQFRRVIGGRGSAADEAAVREAALQLGVDAGDIGRLNALVEKATLWRLVAGKTGLDPELIWKRQASGRDTHAALAASVVPPRRRGVPWWIGAAASVMLAAGGMWGWKQWAQDGGVSAHVVAAQAGQRVQYRLPDGTQVLLAPESKLTFKDWSPAGPRDLALEGEAYFDVKHDEARPFRVRIRDAVVEDLGTEFVIRAYPREADPVVAVRSGSVAIRPPRARAGDGVVLAPGDVARIDPRGIATKVAADTGAWFGWMHGRLVFHDAPLADVLRQLRRWYDIEVSAADPVALGVEVTLAITERSSPAEAVAYVADILNVRVERRGAAFILTGER